jgi:hypothetical protein
MLIEAEIFTVNKLFNVAFFYISFFAVVHFYNNVVWIKALPITKIALMLTLVESYAPFLALDILLYRIIIQYPKLPPTTRLGLQEHGTAQTSSEKTQQKSLSF